MNPSPRRFLRSTGPTLASLTLGLLLAWSGIAQGVERTWNGGGTDNLWTTAANWGGTAPSAGDTLLFGGTTRLSPSNDFPAGTSLAGITFNDGAGAFTLAGNRISLSGDVVNNDADLQTLNLDMLLNATRTFNTATGSMTVTGVLSGTGGLNKTGGQLLRLSGTSANTYSGLTTVSAGTLDLRKTNVNAIAGDLAITGGKVTFGGNNQIADTAAVTMSGAGSVFNGTGNNTGYPDALVETIGSLDISGGIFNTSPSGANWTVTGAGRFTGGDGKTIFIGNSGARLSFGSLSLTAMNGTASLGDNNFTLFGNNGSFCSSITVGSGGLTLNDSALNLRRGTSAGTLGSRLVLDGNVTTAGSKPTSIKEDAGGTYGTIGVELSSVTTDAVARTFDVGSGADLTISVPITNGAATTANIIKTGPGTLFFTGTLANTYTGTTTINAGVLNLGKTANVTAVAGDLIVNTGGTLTLAANQQIADTVGITVNGGTISGWGTDETIASYTQNAGGAPSWGNTGHVTVTGAFTLAGGSTLTVNSNSSNPAAWTVGSATLTGADILLGANSGTGKSRTSFTIGAGGLSMGGRTITVNRGTSGAEVVLNGNFTGTGTNNIIAGDVGPVEPRLVIGSATRTFEVKSGITTVGVAIEGSGGGLTKTGGGTLVLSGNNTYSGKTTVSSGVLKITSATALGTEEGITELFTDGTKIDSVQLEVAGGITVRETFARTGGVGPGNSGLIYSSSGNNVFTQDIDLGWAAGTRLNVANGSSLTFNGKVTSPEAFRKLGAGTLILTQETPGLSRSAYIGDPSLGSNGGTVLLGHDRSLGTATIEFATAGGIASSSTAARSLANPMAIATTGIVTLGTATTGNLTVSGNVTLTQDATIAVANASSTLSGVISGESKSLTKTGPGTLVLSGANTYSGNTTVSQGTLLVNGSHTSAGAYQVLSGATLGGSHEPGEKIQTSGLTVQAGGFLAPGNSIGEFHIDGPVTIGETAGLGTWLVEYDGTGAGSIDLLTVSGTLDIANTAVEFQKLNADLDGLSPYVFATYGSLVGSQFAAITGLPSGYSIDYAYAGNQIALVSLAVPEPSSLASLAILSLMSLGLVRCRRRRMSNVESQMSKE